MQKISVAHISDVHLGSTYANLPYEKSKQRSKEALHTFIKSIHNCSDCDVILLSGDIFDSAYISFSVADLFLSAIGDLKNTQVFYSCGNHDSYYTDVVKYCIKNSPDNLHIFEPDSITYFTVESIKTRIYGVSFSKEHQYEALFNTMPDCDSDYINVLCMHADILSEKYNPINTYEFSNTNLDYVALGHIHQFDGVKRAASCFYAYSGVLEGRGFDECGKKGYLKGKISKNLNELKFCSVAKRAYVDETIDISDFKDEYEIVDIINSICSSSENICRFTFVGENNLNKQIDIKFLESQCRCFYCICIDKTKENVPLDNYIGYPGLIGACATETKRLIDFSDNIQDKEKYKKAFKLLANILMDN